jgi:hypothetical protein
MGGGGYELWDAGVSIKVDGAGNAYLTGIAGTDTDIFTGAHFPILNAFQPQRASSYYKDAFVTKVSPQGALISGLLTWAQKSMQHRAPRTPG